MIGLIDKVTEPSKKAGKSIIALQTTVKNAAMDIAAGGTSIYSGFAFMNKMTAATREFSRAGQEVSSLGVVPEELDKLNAAAKDYVKTFGGSATEVVRSAYDIQSAIPGLADGALAAFTVNSATLAKATKADAATITGYMGNMYNIFQKDADKLGQAKWVEQMAGKTAYAVKMFKTDGAKMTQAFAGIGSTATLMGVSMSEQMAVLGTLQSSGMNAANAGTAYKGFMSKLVQGQETLGLSFKGEDGQLLPVYEILEKIKGSVGSLDKDQQVAMLSKAFGETGAMAVMNMLDKTEQLKGAVGDLDRITGNELANDMAQKQVDELARFQGIWDVLKISGGAALLPAFNVVLSGVSALFGAFATLLDVCPPLRWALAALFGAVALLAIGFGMLKISSGVRSGYEAMIKIFHGLRFAVHHCTLATLKNVAAWIWEKTVMIAAHLWTVLLTTAKLALAAVVGVRMVASLAAYAAGWLLVKGVLLISTIATYAASAATWLFSAALWACPITWIVAGIVALIAAVALVIVYWDEICAWFKRSWEWLLLLAGPIGWIVFAFRKWDKIKEIAASVWEFVAGGFVWLWDKIKAVGTAIVEFFSGIWGWVASAFSSVMDTVIGVIDSVIGTVMKVWNWITGGDDAEVGVKVKRDEPVISGGAARVRDVPAGGVRSGAVSNRTVNYGGVTVNAPNGLTPGQLEEWSALQG
ncbi:MAG: phage tail tape measure protein [Victivallaceae bacterium]|nr:phage tail tape measure protein [Victivallaceae bacterium]